MLNALQMDAVGSFMDAVFIRMEAGDMDLDDGFNIIKSALSKFDPGQHIAAMTFMVSIASANPEETAFSLRRRGLTGISEL